MSEIARRPSWFGSLRDRALRVWQRLRGGELTPGRLAASVALGLFIGVQPAYGLHLVLCLALCLPLRLDFVTTYLAANVSIAPLAPFLLVLEVELGALVLTGRLAPFSLEAARQASLAGFATHAMLGALLFGLGLALVGGGVTWALAWRLRRPTPLSAAIARTIDRYATGSRADRGYVTMKLSSDPIVGLLAALGPLGRLVDAGAGRGQLGLLLLELGAVSELLAFDWDERKVTAARRAARGEARVEQGSLSNWDFGEADTVLLVDVLHYLSPGDQDAVLARAARSLARGGRLLVREVDARPGLATLLTTLPEWIGTGLRYNRGAQLAFRPAHELVSVLTGCGLDCEVRPAAEGTPLANVLIIAQHREGAPPPAG